MRGSATSPGLQSLQVRRPGARAESSSFRKTQRAGCITICGSRWTESLKSWAVTKGPSLTVGDKRLAVRTEDHPIEYLNFEGNIPKGEYGAGSMIVWDRGRWEPDGDPQKGLAKGHLAFTLDGARLKGHWHLARMRPRSGEKTEPWLLIKSDDEFARGAGDREVTEEETTSQISGRTNEELAATFEIRKDHAARVRVAKARKAFLPDIGELSGARAGLLPVFLEPSLAASCAKPPSGPKWIHEIKYDGYRMQARIDGRKIQLLTRKKLDWTERFLSIADALKALGLGSALIDGESWSRMRAAFRASMICKPI